MTTYRIQYKTPTKNSEPRLLGLEFLSEESALTYFDDNMAPHGYILIQVNHPHEGMEQYTVGWRNWANEPFGFFVQALSIGGAYKCFDMLYGRVPGVRLEFIEKNDPFSPRNETVFNA